MTVLKGEGTHPIIFATRSVPVRARIHTAYVATPDQAGRFPTCLVVGGARGLSSSVRDLCRRLARHGIAAVAPDVYAGAPVPGEAAAAATAFGALDPAATRRILTDVGRYISDPAGPWATSDGFGVVAIQAGAAWGLQIAIDSAAPLVMIAPELRDPPRDGLPGVGGLLPEMVEPLLGLIGREDEVSSVDDVMVARNLVPHSQWVLYDGVGHDFFDDSGPGFDQTAFADAFDRIVDFVTKHL